MPVSILVLLEPPLIRQFLFWLILNSFGFNPCFTGTSSHTWRKLYVSTKANQFQSLFYWNLLSYFPPHLFFTSRIYVSILVLLEPPLIQIETSLRGPNESSFNPCFTGTSSHTPFSLFNSNKLVEFQSLFYWNLLSYHGFNDGKMYCRHVSILVLLEPPLIQGFLYN